MTTSEQINEIAAASAKAQLELRPAIKDAVNPAFRSKYADYAAIVDAAKVYAKHGIAVFQDVTTTEAGAAVETRLAHSSGQWISFGPLTVPMTKRDAHGTGSATTYAKRYALSAALGISADEDDDGNAASQSNGRETQHEPAQRQQQAASVPPGFDNWLTDLTAVADEGTAALEAAWKKSQPYLRKYLTDTNNSGWTQLKAHAAKVVIRETVPA